MLVHWLSRRTEVVGVVWIKATAWQQSWKGRLEFTRKRFKRYGLSKTIDEILYFLYYHTFLGKNDVSELYDQVIAPYQRKHGSPSWAGDEITAGNVNDADVLNFLRERGPDVAFAMCINNFFGKKLRSIPRRGVLLWHEGITPEYRGLYSPFWAVHNLDFDRIGYTLLLMNERLDGGDIYVQGQVKEIDPYRQRHGYIGHKAIVDSLPDVARFIERFEKGEAEPIQRADAEDGYYTYPGMSDYLRQQRRLRRSCTKESTASVK